ncbi:hypothetical protein Trco_002945, partial [Trichoderma cornu-damae]
DVVEPRGSLEHGPRRRAVVVIVHVENVGRAAPVGAAVVGGQAHAAVALGGVGLVEQRDGRDEQLEVEDVELGVEVVVHQVEPVLGRVGGQVRRALDRAGKRPVGGIKGRLPHLGELVHEPGVGRLVGLVVEEHDDAAAADDHVLQRGPVVQAHGEDGGHEGVLEDARLLDKGHVERRVRVVAVAQQDGDDVVGMRVHPLHHLPQPVGDGPGVEQVAGRVAEVRHRAVGRPLHLRLQEAHAIVELRLDGQLLGCVLVGCGAPVAVAETLAPVASEPVGKLTLRPRLPELDPSLGLAGAGEGDLGVVCLVDARGHRVAAHGLRFGALVKGEAGCVRVRHLLGGGGGRQQRQRAESRGEDSHADADEELVLVDEL